MRRSRKFPTSCRSWTRCASWTRRTVAPLILMAAVAAGCNDASDPLGPMGSGVDEVTAAEADGLGHGAAAFTVMTRNVYIGGDTNLVFQALAGGDPTAIVTAAATVWAQVQASDIPGRAAAIVEEIDRERPHVVALQEAVRFQRLDGQLTIDWIEELEMQIELQTAPYEVVAIQPGTQVVLPIGPDVSNPANLLQVTDRIAVLKRTDVATADVQQANFPASLSAPLAEGVTLERGWIRFETEHRGVPHHVIATHLETQGIAEGLLNAGQGQYLLNAVAAGLDGFTYIAGDLNSDAAAVPGAPSWTPTYGILTGAGFVDGWLYSEASETSAGFTCCHDPSLLNPTPTLDERIDFVLVRGAAGSGYTDQGSFQAEIVGDEIGDMLSPSGLWPADHAGLSVTTRLPVALAQLP